MRSSLLSGICLCSGLLLFLPRAYSAEANTAVTAVTAPVTTTSSQGEVTSDNINIRTDSTTSAKVICVANKGERLEIVKELYDWYKIRLPKTAPSFIKKSLVTPIDEKTAKVAKNNVNIRLEPNESSAILGKANENEIINILEDAGEWYKIEPVSNSYGWVHKRFITKNLTPPKQEIKVIPPPAPDDTVVIEGVIKPYGMVFRRVATHKLFTSDNKVYLLKGNKKTLDTLNYHKVRVTGKPISAKNQKYPTIETQKIEALD